VPQVTLNGRERRKSLRKAFICSTKIDISGASICLVDDVYTTGTTVSECSRALLAGGAERVVVLTLARVDVPHRGRGRN
jgi:predicted amidophosphoribosyltransferase